MDLKDFERARANWYQAMSILKEHSETDREDDLSKVYSFIEDGIVYLCPGRLRLIAKCDLASNSMIGITEKDQALCRRYHKRLDAYRKITEQDTFSILEWRKRDLEQPRFTQCDPALE